MVLLSSIQPEAETSASHHALPRNLLMFPPHEHKQRQHCQVMMSRVVDLKRFWFNPIPYARISAIQFKMCSLYDADDA